LSLIETPPPQAKLDGPIRYLLDPTDIPGEFILRWSYSGAAAFMRCPRSAENHYIFLRRLNKDQSPLTFGKLFHKLTEAKDRSGLTPETLAFQLEQTAKHFMEYPCAPTDHRNGATMFKLMQQYNDRYKLDGWDKKVFMFEDAPFIERPFKIELCSIPVNAEVPYSERTLLKDGSEAPTYIKTIHVHYEGIVDLVLEEAGNLWVTDRKTTSRGGEEFWNAFRLSHQTRMYAWAVWQITGRRPLGCIIDGAIVRRETKTGKGIELDRKNSFYSEESLLESAQSMRAHVSDFIGCLVRGFFPQSAQSFKSPCAGCDYAENCALPLSQRAADLQSDIYRDVTRNALTEQ
jgi:hypothetical protein